MKTATTKLPSQSPSSYKTDKGLFDAFIRALGSSRISIKRAWWLTNALWEAEQRSPRLLTQFRRLQAEAAPKTIDDLIPLGESRPTRRRAI